jgi:hypothetical protein
MNNRTTTYFNRKKAYKSMLNPTDLKSLLKAEFFSTSNPIVKRDVLKVYEELNKVNNIGAQK